MRCSGFIEGERTVPTREDGVLNEPVVPQSHLRGEDISVAGGKTSEGLMRST